MKPIIISIKFIIGIMILINTAAGKAGEVNFPHMYIDKNSSENFAFSHMTGWN